jgi:lipopolysaccharide/colanic/teichoic acid biosynthesis glycosyltransferase
MGESFGSHVDISMTRDMVVRPVVERRQTAYLNLGKRVIDLVLVVATLPVVVATVALCALLVALDGGNPFYTQDRIGRNGRRFRMWKLRSMVVNAEERLEEHLAANPAARVEWNSKQKLANDPRVTRIGRILRKTSLDELPQLWNVLKGDMSLVGPRPMMPGQMTLYNGEAYFRMRPGITGPWQTSARNHTAFADRVWYDEDYWRRVSLGTDMVLLLRTVRVLLRPTGM